MSWTVLFHSAFDAEFDDLQEDVQDELLAQAKLLEEFGPTLGRPRVDTLKGSRHPNMKELRFDAAAGVWRVHRLTQERVGESLGIGQEGVSRLEKRSDLLLSTLRSYVEAMGGHLQIVAEFPDRPPVVLCGVA